MRPVPQERTALAASFATEKLWRWQHRLALEDWNITVTVSRVADLKPRTLGNIHWDLKTRTATIRVLDPADYTLTGAAMLRDIETTVVHELVHLTLAPMLDRTDANRSAEENAVNRITENLLRQ
jgi:hypothetical protein